jgi:hypothetical protein
MDGVFPPVRPKCEHLIKRNRLFNRFRLKKTALSRMEEFCLKKARFFYLIFSWCSASVAFAKDTRHQARRRISILQAVYNAVDLVKEALPEGSVFPK